MSEITDNNIIKALEYCSSPKVGEQCPRRITEFSCNEGCMTMLMFDVLDLINRKNAELADKDDAITHQANTIKMLEQAIKDKLAEIERLEFSNEHWNDWEVKCRAINEFWDKLKKNTHNYYPSIDHYCTSRKVIAVIDGDNLAKEMTEQS